MLKARVLTVVAILVVAAVPALMVDAKIAMDSPVRAILKPYPLPLVILALSFVLAAKLVDWLRESEWVTQGAAGTIGLLAMIAQIAALGVTLLGA